MEDIQSQIKAKGTTEGNDANESCKDDDKKESEKGQGETVGPQKLIDYQQMTSIDRKFSGRASRGKDAKYFMIYPDDFFKTIWDFISTGFISVTCTVTPFYIAFPELITSAHQSFDITMNIVFFIDILLNFNMAYLDQDHSIVDNYKKIAVRYLSGWFIIDLTSVIPFDSLYEMGGLHKMARFSRIAKIYKLIRMTRFVRLIKVVKIKNIFAKHLAEILKDLCREVFR
ncbi:hypothetical protein FGO68_gene4313 [Halteria grandinella]|uniref:Ion transport domain-containing protein n=1 Tax=Halteria grandinella TaxID=5974 RepID=A0A8J8P377_HALGN|nr:hypothetical protein FGO68_gene4313 [Halteria grandinella]